MNRKNEHIQKDAPTKKSQLNDTSARSQRLRLVAYLRELGSIDRFCAQEKLNILSLATRIFELRELGYEIYSDDRTTQDPHGRLHRGVTRYVLIAEPQAGGSNA